MTLKYRLSIHRSLGSTMDEARDLANAGVAEGIVVQALEQTAGRGRFGNQWDSPTGNLFMTIVLRPKKPLQECAQLSFVAAVAMAQACDEFGVGGLQLKWPNDALVNGQKLAGILLEMEGQGDTPDFLLLGMGINVSYAPDGKAKLQDQNADVDAATFREALLIRLAQWYDVWQRDGFAPVRAAWVKRAYGLGQGITARLANTQITGTFVDIDRHGALVMTDSETGKARMITGGEVHFG